MQVRVDRERQGVTSLVTSRERAVQVLRVRVPAVQAQTDPRVLVGVVVDVRVAVPVGPGVVQEGNRGVVQEANLQGSPDREQAVNQGEADLHARGKTLRFKEKVQKSPRNPLWGALLSAPQ